MGKWQLSYFKGAVYWFYRSKLVYEPRKKWMLAVGSVSTFVASSWVSLILGHYKFVSMFMCWWWRGSWKTTHSFFSKPVLEMLRWRNVAVPQPGRVQWTMLGSTYLVRCFVITQILRPWHLLCICISACVKAALVKATLQTVDTRPTVPRVGTDAPSSSHQETHMHTTHRTNRQGGARVVTMWLRSPVTDSGWDHNLKCSNLLLILVPQLLDRDLLKIIVWMITGANIEAVVFEWVFCMRYWFLPWSTTESRVTASAKWNLMPWNWSC